MKIKLLISAILASLSILASAQFYVWSGGSVVMSIKSGMPDSITFVDPLAKFNFSVSDKVKVQFSPGNLQFCSAYFEWRFAEHQYDIIGQDNKFIDYDYDGWIDLFGWGTCGWDIGFEPSCISTDYRDYLVGGAWNNSLVDKYALADWGVSNSQYLNAEGEDYKWRTLTGDEWNYLFTGRPDASQLFGLAVVCGRKGLIILPDEWKPLSNIPFLPSANNKLLFQNGFYQDDEMLTDNFQDNVFGPSEWAQMESAGAIFLPAAGRRNGKTWINNNDNNLMGYYWSTTVGKQEREGNVNALFFYKSGVTPFGETARYWGCSVRLVREVE